MHAVQSVHYAVLILTIYISFPRLDRIWLRAEVLNKMEQQLDLHHVIIYTYVQSFVAFLHRHYYPHPVVCILLVHGVALWVEF